MSPADLQSVLQALAHALFAPHTAPATRQTADECLKACFYSISAEHKAVPSGRLSDRAISNRMLSAHSSTAISTPGCVASV